MSSKCRDKALFPFGKYSFSFERSGMVDAWTEHVTIVFDENGWTGESRVVGVDEEATDEERRLAQQEEWDRRRAERQSEIEAWEPQDEDDEPPEDYDEDPEEIDVECDAVYSDWVRVDTRTKTFDELATCLDDEGSVEPDLLMKQIEDEEPELAAYIRAECMLNELAGDDMKKRERLYPHVRTLLAIAGDDE
ncbi:MAG TPA: hypothetical protein VGE01_13000 [Fimbriimonas sp.]